MTHNKLSILPWYDTLEEQHHRQDHTYGQVYPLYTDLSKILPFQLVRDATNHPIASFKLHRMETGVETELYDPEMIDAGLAVWNDGEENYPDSATTPQVPGGSPDSSSWGMSFAPNGRKFRYLQIKLHLYDGANVPENFRCVIRKKSNGVIQESVDLNIGSVLAPIEKLITFDFGEVVEMPSSPDAIWLEVTSDGYIRPVGRDGDALDYSPEQEVYGLSTGDLSIAPSTAVGSAGDFDAHVRTWGDVSNFDMITFPGNIAINHATPIGQYYCIMQDEDENQVVQNTWYSEVFCVRDDISSMIKLTYWHRYDFLFDGGRINYENGFRNFFYLCSDIVKPLYQEIVEVRPINGVEQGVFFVSYKVRRFAFVAPEFLLDAIRVMFMHHDKLIEYKGKSYTVNKIQFIPSWGGIENHGDVADVICEFRTDEIVVQRGDNVAPLPEPVGQEQWIGDGGLWTGDGGIWEG